VTPDAGASTGEVTNAFAQFAEELSAVGELLTTASDVVRDSLRQYQSTDDGVAAGYRGMAPR
jgi:uncharacterized protein YukE